MNSVTLLLLFLPARPLPQPSSFSRPSFSVSCLFKPSSSFLSLWCTLLLSPVFFHCSDWLGARQTIQLGNAFSSRLPLWDSNKSNTLKAVTINASYTHLHAHTGEAEGNFLFCLHLEELSFCSIPASSLFIVASLRQRHFAAVNQSVKCPTPSHHQSDACTHNTTVCVSYSAGVVSC